MGTKFEEIRIAKTKEAEILFEKIGIPQTEQEENHLSGIPTYSENSNPEKEETKFHWTRLSINSNSSYVIE